MTKRERDKRLRAAQREILRARVRLQRDTAGEIITQLNLALDRIRALLAAQPTDYQLWSLPQIRANIEAAIKEMNARTASVIGTAAGQAWETGIASVEAPLAAGGAAIAAQLPAIDTRQLLAMRHFMTDRITDIGLASINKINTELGLVVIAAQSPGEAVSTITTLFKEGARSRALTITRTELGRAFSVAAQERRLEAAAILPGLKKQWRRSGKIHSRPSHDAADGQIRDVDEPFNVGGYALMFPRDPTAPASETINCGCEALDYMEDWDVSTPGRRPFTDEELAQNVFKRDLEQALSGGRRTAA